MILSIQSNVIHGHVGNGASLPIYHHFGMATQHLDTIRLAAHPGHGTTARDVMDGAIMSAIYEDYLKLVHMPNITAIHTGYFGSSEQVRITAKFMARMKERFPDMICLIDPVIGDKGRLYVAEDIPRALADDLLPLADIITPNQFELSYLSGQPITQVDDAITALKSWQDNKTMIAIATGITQEDKICDIACHDKEIHRHEASLLSSGVSGGGDAFAALFLAHYLAGKPVAEALSDASSAAYQMVINSQSPLDLNIASGLCDEGRLANQ